MFKTIWISVVVSFLFLNLSHSFAQTTLEYKVNKGESYDYDMSAIINQTFTQMGQEMKIDMKLTSDLNLSVTNVAKNITLEMVYRKSMLSMSGMETMGVADTTMDASEQLAFKQEYVFTKSGEMVSHKVIEDPKVVLDDQTKMMKQQLTSQLKQSTDFIILKYPSKNLKVGDSWKTTDTIEVSGIKTLRNFTHTYVSTKSLNGINLAELNSKSTSISINGTVNQMGMEMDVRGGMNVEGTSLVNSMTGMLVSLDMNVTSDLTMSMSSPMEMTIPIELKMITTIKKK